MCFRQSEQQTDKPLTKPVFPPKNDSTKKELAFSRKDKPLQITAEGGGFEPRYTFRVRRFSKGRVVCSHSPILPSDYSHDEFPAVIGVQMYTTNLFSANILGTKLTRPAIFGTKIFLSLSLSIFSSAGNVIITRSKKGALRLYLAIGLRPRQCRESSVVASSSKRYNFRLFYRKRVDRLRGKPFRFGFDSHTNRRQSPSASVKRLIRLSIPKGFLYIYIRALTA